MKMPRWGRRSDEDFAEEIRTNIAIDADQLAGDGMSPDEARAAAHRAFGNVAHAQERFYESRRIMWLDDLRRDLQLAWRSLGRNRGFTLTAVLTLALGIGANTAVFSLINTVILRPLPVRQPEQLVELLFKFPGDPRLNMYSWTDYVRLRDENQVFSGLLAISRSRHQVMGELLEAEVVDAMYVGGNFFDALGVQPAIGKLIDSQNDRVGSAAAAVAVISWSYWQSRFNLDPAVLGRPLSVNGVPTTIIGVTPREFFGVQVGLDPPLWLPIAAEPLLRNPSQLTNGTLSVALFARIKPGISLQQATAEMRVLDRPRLEQGFARFKDPRWRQIQIEVSPAASGITLFAPSLRDRFGSSLLLTMAAVGVLLLMACVNVASMMLARGVARRREMAVRVALGAGRYRLVRQVLTEALLLSTIGGMLGVLLAYAAAGSLARFMASGRAPVGMQQPLQIPVDLDLNVLLVVASSALITTLVFGLAPAWNAFVSLPSSPLRDSGGAAEPKASRTFGRGLIVAQVALSTVLLAAAALFVRHLSDLRTVGVGFSGESVLQFRLDRMPGGLTPTQLASLQHQLLERLALIPGVRSTSYAAMTPISGVGGSLFVDVEGFVEPREDRRRVRLNTVAPKYFETLSTPFIAGRDFEAADADRPRVAIVNEAMARYYFGTSSPLGRQFTFEGQTRPLEIVGVVGDAKYNDLHETPPRTVYTNALQGSGGSGGQSMFVLRTNIPPTSIASDVRRVVAELMPTAAVARVMTLAEQMDASILPERLMAMLSTLFGVLAALLVVIGLYGVLAYTVAHRTSEIGLRVALGATSRDVTRMVLTSALGLVCAGLVIGAPVAYWARGHAANVLSIVTAAQADAPVTLPVDSTVPLVLAAVSLLAVALVASYVPVRRATTVDPMVALRHE
jgi:predicted permease